MPWDDGVNWKNEWKAPALIGAVFPACFRLPVGTGRFDGAVIESLHPVKWYARERRHLPPARHRRRKPRPTPAERAMRSRASSRSLTRYW